MASRKLGAAASFYVTSFALRHLILDKDHHYRLKEVGWPSPVVRVSACRREAPIKSAYPGSRKTLQYLLL